MPIHTVSILVCAVASLLAVGAVAFALQRVRAERPRVLGLLLLQFATPLLPWLIPPQHDVLRFFGALGVILAFVRIWQTHRGLHPIAVRRDLVSYLIFFASLPDLVISESAEQRRAARREGLAWAGRALLKGGALLTMLALSTALPELHLYAVAHVYWLLFATYVAASGFADAHGALTMLLCGHRGKPVFDAPFLASSPRDFWSRRWNLMFRNSAHALIFTPIGGSTRPLLGVVLVFAWSAIAHEYLVVVPLGESSLQMTAFFALHCLGTLLNGSWPRLVRSRVLAIALHWVWLGLTSPLFFAPLVRVFPAHTWLLW